MLDGVICLGHNAIKFIKDNKVIYIDPFKIEDNYNDADLIFITHSHYDHFSKEDILKVKKEFTKIIITEDLYNDSIEMGFSKDNILVIKPNSKYLIDSVKFSTISSYNINKNFHPKDNNWVGYILLLNNYSYYIIGDSDITDENKQVKCDVLFVPIGGIYTMDYKEASLLTNVIKPKIVIPVHYGIIVGEKDYALKFKELVSDEINCKIMY